MIAALFPGQGSQKPGMGKELYDSHAAARNVFSEVRSATHVDIAKLCFEADEDTLRQTQNAQLALFTCGVAAFRAFKELEPGVHFEAMAGHSVGEYAALAASGIMSVAEGAKLVARRGDLMARSGNLRPGTMAAVLGVEKALLEDLCEKSSTNNGAVVIANDNCPGQLVISGDKEAVQAASALAAENGGKVMPLNVSGAFHSPLMEEPATAMGEALRPEFFSSPDGETRVYSNVTADRVDGVTSWPSLLEAQLRSPVRWNESMNNMLRDGVKVFIEFGSGEVLGGLMKRISKEATRLAVYDKASMEKARAALSQVEVNA